VAETYAKAAGLMAACGLLADPAPAPRPSRHATDPEVRQLLTRRNATLSRFWLNQHHSPTLAARPDPPASGGAAGPADPAGVIGLAGRRVLVADGEDMFTAMFSHLVRALGTAVDVHPATDLPPLDGYDLVVAGPGPGDPRDASDPRIAALRRLVLDRLDAARPLLAVCLGHQLLAAALGLPVHRRDTPHQGIQRTVDFFGRPERVAFYSTFAARCTTPTLPTPYGTVELSTDPDSTDVTALRGPGFAGIQFHVESLLTEHGPTLLHELLHGILHHPRATGQGGRVGLPGR
jgi:phenazine biosynthesis protein phzE